MFTAYSAVTVTGLNVFDTHRMKLGSQIALFVLISSGSIVAWSLVPAIIRRYYFRKKMQEEIQIKIYSKSGRERYLKVQYLSSLDAKLETEPEYKALGWIIKCGLFHMTFWPLLCTIIYGLHLSLDPRAVEKMHANGVSPWWFAVFHSNSAFNNAGFSLFADNLMQFSNDYLLLNITALQILFGNIAYPVMLHLYVHWLKVILPSDSSLKLLLARPRKFFTHLFDFSTTKTLFFIIVCTTLSEFFFFLIFELRSNYMLSYSPGDAISALIGWFQAISTRTAGFAALDLGQAAPPMILVVALFLFFLLPFLSWVWVFYNCCYFFLFFYSVCCAVNFSFLRWFIL
jgi:hypothetical protein